MKSVSFRNLVLLSLPCCEGECGDSTKYESGQEGIGLEDVCRVDFDAVEEVIVG